MTSDLSIHLQGLIDRLHQGGDSARNELVGFTYERLRHLAHKMLHEDFPRLQEAHATGSVLNEAVLRLLSALEQVNPLTARDYFCLAAVQMRRVLLDLARRHRHRQQPPGPADGDHSGGGPPEPADSTYDPARLALWTELHRQVEGLPEAERHVVDLHWYQGLTQQETADLLGISQKEVSRRWIRARLKLSGQMAGLEQLL